MQKVNNIPNTYLEDQGVYTQANNLELGDRNIQMSLIPQIRHPTIPNGPHVIEDD